MEDNSRIVGQMKCALVEVIGQTYKFYLNSYLFDETLKYGDCVNFEVMLRQTLNNCVEFLNFEHCRT
jgi:hypothetical protein